MTSFATPLPGVARSGAGASRSGVLLRWMAWRLGLYGMAAVVSMAGAAGVMVAISLLRPDEFRQPETTPSAQTVPPDLAPIKVTAPPDDTPGGAVALASPASLPVIKQASANVSLSALLDSPGTVVTMPGSAAGRSAALDAELEKLRQAIRDGHGAVALKSATGRPLVATLGKSEDVVIRSPSAATPSPGH